MKAPEAEVSDPPQASGDDGSRTQADTFPIELHRMLMAIQNDPELTAMQEVVRWDPNGSSFKLDKKRFVAEVMPK
jgi:hypothetical protein